MLGEIEIDLAPIHLPRHVADPEDNLGAFVHQLQIVQQPPVGPRLVESLEGFST